MSLKTDSKLERILADGHLAVTSECGPPRGSDPEVIIKKGELLKGHVDAVLSKGAERARALAAPVLSPKAPISTLSVSTAAKDVPK